MTFDPTCLEAIIFDYGNTLIKFDQDEVRYTDGEMKKLHQER